MNQDSALLHLRRWSRPDRSRAIAAALASVLLVGCGSTVQVRSAAAVGQDGVSVLPPADGARTGTAGNAGTAGSDASGTALTPGGGATLSSGASTTAGGRPARGPSAAGGTAAAAAEGGSRSEPVRIGIITQPGLEAAAKAFGLDGVTTGDTRKQADAVIAWVRENGGLGGHPITVYEYAVDMSDGSNAAIQNNACTAMAQDYKVRFVVTVLANLQILTSCLAKFGIGLLADNSNLGDRTMAEYARVLGNPSELGAGRMMNLLVDDLARRGWLTASAKIGVLADDGPDGHATVDGPLTAALRRHGLKAASTVWVNPNTGDGGSSQSSSAVLKFRSAGVDRVIPVAYSPLYFMIAAENQGYRPAYAMVSAQGPGALLEGTAPANQLKNAAGIGWAPYLDIAKGTRPGPVSKRETLCFDLMRKAGQAATSALVKGFQAQVCDMLFYLKDIADREPAIPADILTSGRIALGSGFVSPATYRVDVTNRTAGVAGYRPLAYQDDCDCFQYVGPVVAAP